MIIFYSGSCGTLKGLGLVAEAEDRLSQANIMLSAYLVQNKMQDQKQRLERIVVQQQTRRAAC